MDKHVITFILSGSWKEDEVIEDGETEHSVPYTHQAELFVEAECSCGRTFNSDQEAYEHVEKIKEKQSD